MNLDDLSHMKHLHFRKKKSKNKSTLLWIGWWICINLHNLESAVLEGNNYFTFWWWIRLNFELFELYIFLKKITNNPPPPPQKKSIKV